MRYVPKITVRTIPCWRCPSYPAPAPSCPYHTLSPWEQHCKPLPSLPSLCRTAVIAANMIAPPNLPSFRHNASTPPGRVSHLVTPTTLPAPVFGFERTGAAHRTSSRGVAPVVERRVRLVLVGDVGANLLGAGAVPAIEVFAPGMHTYELMSNNVAHLMLWPDGSERSLRSCSLLLPLGCRVS